MRASVVIVGASLAGATAVTAGGVVPLGELVVVGTMPGGFPWPPGGCPGGCPGGSVRVVPDGHSPLGAGMMSSSF